MKGVVHPQHAPTRMNLSAVMNDIEITGLWRRGRDAAEFQLAKRNQFPLLRLVSLLALFLDFDFLL